MSAEINTETAKQEQPKSKRLSSLIWILVLWGFVRLISELDHISWKRSFPTDAVIFGLWPATLFLVLAVMPRTNRYVSLLRWAAFLAVLGSFSLLLFFNRQSDAISYMVVFQKILTLVVLCGAGIHWGVKCGGKND